MLFFCVARERAGHAHVRVEQLPRFRVRDGWVVPSGTVHAPPKDTRLVRPSFIRAKRAVPARIQAPHFPRRVLVGSVIYKSNAVDRYIPRLGSRSRIRRREAASERNGERRMYESKLDAYAMSHTSIVF